MSQRYFDHEDLAMLKEVLDAGCPASYEGKMTPRLQEAFTKAVGAKHAVGVNSGMSALHACVAAADASTGDEVICDPMVQFGSAAVLYNNAVPVYADVNYDTHLIDPDSIRARITERTKAILCTHLWGVPCDMDEIMAIAREHNLVVIEDNAHALFAEYKGRQTGTLGHVAEFSFQIAKHLGVGDGGMATTNDDFLHERLLAYSGIRNLCTFPELMWNYRMSELVAAVALVQLGRARKYVEQAVANSRIYDEAVRDIRWIRTQTVPPDRTSACHIWAGVFEGDKAGLDRETFAGALEKVKCQKMFGYIQYPAYLHDVIRKPLAYKRGCPIYCPHYKGALRYQAGACPVAEDLMPRLILIGTVGTPDEHKRNAEKLRRVAEELG